LLPLNKMLYKHSANTEVQTYRTFKHACDSRSQAVRCVQLTFSGSAHFLPGLASLGGPHSFFFSVFFCFSPCPRAKETQGGKWSKCVGPEHESPIETHTAEVTFQRVPAKLRCVHLSCKMHYVMIWTANLSRTENLLSIDIHIGYMHASVSGRSLLRIHEIQVRWLNVSFKFSDFEPKIGRTWVLYLKKYKICFWLIYILVGCEFVYMVIQSMIASSQKSDSKPIFLNFRTLCRTLAGLSSTNAKFRSYATHWYPYLLCCDEVTIKYPPTPREFIISSNFIP